MYWQRCFIGSDRREAYEEGNIRPDMKSLKMFQKNTPVEVFLVNLFNIIQKYYNIE